MNISDEEARKKATDWEQTIYNRHSDKNSDSWSKMKSPVGIFTNLVCIGKGSYGEVYKANLSNTDKVVAIKTMPTGEDDDSITNEIDLMRSLDHPNLLQYYQTFIYQGSIWLIMEFCVINLSQFMRKFRVLSANSKASDLMKRIEPSTYYFLHEIASGLNYMHNKNIIHRDIKGQNILLSPGGQVKICDFGIAKQAAGSDTSYETVIGTPHFMSPEIINKLNNKKSNTKYTVMADIYSLAATAYEMITLNPPKSEMRPNELMILMAKHRSGFKILPKETKWFIQVPKEVIDKINQMFDTKPTKRPKAIEIVEFFKSRFERRACMDFISSLLLSPTFDIVKPKTTFAMQKYMRSSASVENISDDVERLSKKITETDIVSPGSNQSSPQKMNGHNGTEDSSHKFHVIYQSVNNVKPGDVAMCLNDRILFTDSSNIMCYNRVTRAQENLVETQNTAILKISTMGRGVVMLIKDKLTGRQDMMIISHGSNHKTLMQDVDCMTSNLQMDGSMAVCGFFRDKGVIRVLAWDDSAQEVRTAHVFNLSNQDSNEEEWKDAFVSLTGPRPQFFYRKENKLLMIESTPGEWLSKRSEFLAPRNSASNLKTVQFYNANWSATSGTTKEPAPRIVAIFDREIQVVTLSGIPVICVDNNDSNIIYYASKIGCYVCYKDEQIKFFKQGTKELILNGKLNCDKLKKLKVVVEIKNMLIFKSCYVKGDKTHESFFKLDFPRY